MCSPDEGVTYDLQYRRDKPKKKGIDDLKQKLWRSLKSAQKANRKRKGAQHGKVGE